MYPTLEELKNRRQRHLLRYMLLAVGCGLGMGFGLGVLFQLDVDPANKVVILFWTVLSDTLMMVMLCRDFVEVLKMDMLIRHFPLSD